MTIPLARRAAAARALALAAVIGVGTAAPAAAAGDQWWYDTYQVEKNHADGWTGEGVKIAVIDEQINPELPVFAGTNLTVAPEALCEGRSATSTDVATAQHGSTITALLIGNGEGAAGIRGIVPDAEVTFFGLGPEPEGSETDTCDPPAEAGEGVTELGWGIRQAIDAGADVISMSIGANPEEGDAEIVAEAIARGIVMVAAVYNGGADFLDTQVYPWGYRGVVAMNAMDQNGALPIDPDFGIPHIVPGTTAVAAGVDISVIGHDGDWNAAGVGTGSSFAAPLVAGMIAATSQKYPEATGNQLLQSLIRNTGPTDHPLEFSDTDGYGYGLASFTHMLNVDPTGYEDVNPLLDKSSRIAGGTEPTDEQLDAAVARVAAEATPAPSAEPAAAEDDGGMLSGAIVAVIVVIVLLVAAAVVTIVIITRNNRKNRPRSLQ